jgi:hypothetical protein
VRKAHLVAAGLLALTILVFSVVRRDEDTGEVDAPGAWPADRETAPIPSALPDAEYRRAAVAPSGIGAREVHVHVRHLPVALLERYSFDVSSSHSDRLPIHAEGSLGIPLPRSQVTLSLDAVHRASGERLTLGRAVVAPEQAELTFDFETLRATGALNALHVAVELPPGCSGPFELQLQRGHTRVASRTCSDSHAPVAVMWMHGLKPGEYVPVAESSARAWRCVFAPVRVYGDSEARLSIPACCSVSIAVRGLTSDQHLQHLRVLPVEGSRQEQHWTAQVEPQRLAVAFASPGQYVLQVETATLASLPFAVSLAAGQAFSLEAELQPACDVEVRILGIRQRAEISIESDGGVAIPLGAAIGSWRPGVAPLRLRLPIGVYRFTARTEGRSLSSRVQLAGSTAAVELR